jgi:hypothetical protein
MKHTNSRRDKHDLYIMRLVYALPLLNAYEYIYIYNVL